MAIPDRVPIAYERGYRTDRIGRYDNGQFFGSVTATLEPGSGSRPDWPRFKRWYVVPHRFDTHGAHTGSDIWFAGTSEAERTSVHAAEQHLDAWLDTLPDRTYCDIAIALFHIVVDGHVFGLVDQTADHDGADHAELLPDDLGFDPPWDGLYDT